MKIILVLLITATTSAATSWDWDAPGWYKCDDGQGHVTVSTAPMQCQPCPPIKKSPETPTS